MYLVKTPSIVKPLASSLLWKVPTSRQEVYLTFDDGPCPGITERVLDILEQYQAKATFFCIGGNVAKYPDLYAEILRRGHRTGNHTWNHMSGWSFSDFSYYKSVLECAGVVKSTLFRPPYGKITRSQSAAIAKRYSIVMWDVLSADWRADVPAEQCATNVCANAGPGSIVVFHDSDKAKRNMTYALPKALDHFNKHNYACLSLPHAF